MAWQYMLLIILEALGAVGFCIYFWRCLRQQLEYSAGAILTTFIFGAPVAALPFLALAIIFMIAKAADKVRPSLAKMPDRDFTAVGGAR